jgi:hypothetical protein
MKNILIAALLVVTVACGGGHKTPNPTGNPLDPQGNWTFTLQGSQSSLPFAGQLYELNPPTVTSNQMAGFSSGCGNFTVTASGHASGTDSITFTISEVKVTSPASFTLTGTIAPSQTAMSGTWTSTNTGGCVTDVNGTWTASLITPLSGTYAASTNSGITISAPLTENIDQTSATMGQITGTISLGNTPCFSGPLTVISADSSHGGFVVNLLTNPDATTGSSLAFNGTGDGSSFGGTFSISGGTCGGQSFSASLTH